MVIMILERAPAALRGELSRWMMEVRPGVFLGTMSALVRDEIWDLCRTKIGKGACLLIHPAQTEQGFAIRSQGRLTRHPVEHEGLWLIQRPIDTRDLGG